MNCFIKKNVLNFEKNEKSRLEKDIIIRCKKSEIILYIICVYDCCVLYIQFCSFYNNWYSYLEPKNIILSMNLFS